MSSVVAVGTTEPEPGPEPDRKRRRPKRRPKRRRLLDAGGPVEDDETAWQKMEDADVYGYDTDSPLVCVGFDPFNVGDVKRDTENRAITPMGYFAALGDLPMMRWLYVEGADTRDEDLGFCFPMYEAARNGRLEACKWLYDHGAAKDVKRRNPNGRSPLHCTFDKPFWGDTALYRKLSRWLIMNGALCKDDDSGELDAETMKHDLDPENRLDPEYHYDCVQEKKALLGWANDLHRPRTSFLLFLSGALSATEQHTSSTRRTVHPLKLLGGEPGIRQLIGDYYGGFVRGREARIIRQLTEMLPTVFADLHVDTDSSSDK